MKKLALNYNHINRFRISPKHYQYYLTDEKAHELDNKQAIFYNALIALLLDKDKFDKQYIVLQDSFLPFKNKDKDKFRKDFALGHPDKIVLDQYYHDLLIEIAEQAGDCSTLKFALEKGDPNVTHSIKDKKTKLMLECSAPWMPLGTTMIGFHLCEKALPSVFEKVIFSMGYHNQAAWDLNIFDHENKNYIPKNEYILFALENKAPYICEPFRMPNEVIRAGMRENRMLIDILYWCNITGFFPNYSEFNLIKKSIYQQNNLHEKDIEVVVDTLNNFHKVNPGYHDIKTPEWAWIN